MRCYVCDSDTRIIKTRESAGGYGIFRTRECLGTKHHKFKTTETAPGGHATNQLAVRRSGDKKLGEALFEPDRLERDVAIGVIKRISPSQVQETVDDAVATIARRESYEPLDLEERARFPRAEGWVWDHEITTAVEDQLEKRDRMAVVLYALSIRGRRDRDGRDGWSGAEQVLDWIAKRYPYMTLQSSRPGTVLPAQVWQHPGVHAPRPQWLIKRSYGPNVRERNRQFDHEQFKRSIRRSLVGRFEINERDEHVDLISEWVLWGLAGQQVVHTSQLAMGVMDCLRRVDDIAYLRWTSIAKSIESVTEFASEALGLLAYPSPRLILNPSEDWGRPSPQPPSPNVEYRGPYITAEQVRGIDRVNRRTTAAGIAETHAADE